MKILIVEDELPAAKRLTKLIKAEKSNIEIVEVLDSVESAVYWFQNSPAPDLVFMDIQLADGLSFDIFSQAEVSTPVIFTTAYDKYTLKAFKVNSVDYLLKPIDPDELKNALNKFEAFFQKQQEYDNKGIGKLIEALTEKSYKERFLVKIGQSLNYIPVEEITYFYSEDGSVLAQTEANKKYIIDYTLDQLEKVLNPDHFFRINRKFLIQIKSIQKISTWFNSRLILELRPKPESEIIVSRERVSDFKGWLDK
ncbi:MAG: LytTR family DNA-binding domain-containing protein [Saprospiraceae bacterium]|nr:LytTR family DNA-binding domain-containing protein [Saprospiraceae bacterium]